MPTFTANNSAVSAQASEIVTSALTEINAIAQGEAAQAGDSNWALEKLQRLIDRINARDAFIFNVNFTLFPFLANVSPITIGPGGVFQMNQRPIRLVSAALVFSSSGNPIDLPLPVIDDAGYAAIRVKSQTSTLPTKLYYSPDNPLGNIYPWPIPTQANSLRLETWTGITQAIDLTTALAMPPAYWDYIVLTLARDCASSFGSKAVEMVSSAAFMSAHREATKAVQGNNQESPRMGTAEAGQTPRRGARGDFNYMTGQRS